MITLTTPKQVNSVLGGAATVAYDKLVLSSIVYNPLDLSLRAQVKITSTSAPSMQPIVGDLVILPSGQLAIEAERLDFYRQVVLSSGQLASVQTMIRDAQNALESGLIAVGVVAGSQSAGV